MRRGRSCGRCGETVGGRAVVLDDLADHAPTGHAIVVHRRTGRNRRSTGSPSIGPKSRIISSCPWTRHALRGVLVQLSRLNDAGIFNEEHSSSDSAPLCRFGSIAPHPTR
jgi:hypothetical protein